MTLDEINGLELITVKSSTAKRKRNKDRDAIEAGVDLLDNKLPAEKALSFEQAWDALNDAPGEYAWGVLKSNSDSSALAVIAYTAFKTIPGTGAGKSRKPAAAGTVWYLVAEDDRMYEAGVMLRDVVAQHREQVNKSGIVSDLGVLADSVPNCEDIYMDNGFMRLPFDVYVPSLEDGKEKVIDGKVNFLMQPSRRYQNGVPLGLMKRLMGSYLWGGYASPKTGKPYTETMKAIGAAAVRTPKGLVVPFKN